jgi:hypothetical protein
MDTWDGLAGAVIANNTFVHNAIGIEFTHTVTSNVLVANNIFASNGVSMLNACDSGNGTPSVQSNLCDSSGAGCDLVGDPLFRDPGAGDYHLRAGSPAIDAAVCLSQVTVDFDEIARPQGRACDLGAYEYTASP